MSSLTDQSAPAQPYAYADVRGLTRPPVAGQQRQVAEAFVAEPAPRVHIEAAGSASHPATAHQQPVFEATGPAAVPAALLDLARAEATAAGYSAGWAQGVREAREQMAADVAAAQERTRRFDAERDEAMQKALHALDRAAADLEVRAIPSAEQCEDVLLAFAGELAEALLQRELRNDTAGPDALARVLALAPVNEPITVRLSPADHAAVTSDATSPHLNSQREIALEIDPQLQPGDAVAICAATVIDGRLREGLARVRAVLAR